MIKRIAKDDRRITFAAYNRYHMTSNRTLGREVEMLRFMINHYVLFQEIPSVKEISEYMKLSISTVYRYTERLLQAGMLCKDESGALHLPKYWEQTTV